mmetsp:Transcript_13552/g.39080  ORF Transcript_13552/g.39080 Transcript_13552/m.39080 type:complete len:221 (+) Transcript_13552:1049-1711(+)
MRPIWASAPTVLSHQLSMVMGGSSLMAAVSISSSSPAWSRKSWKSLRVTHSATRPPPASRCHMTLFTTVCSRRAPSSPTGGNPPATSPAPSCCCCSVCGPSVRMALALRSLATVMTTDGTHRGAGRPREGGGCGCCCGCDGAGGGSSSALAIVSERKLRDVVQGNDGWRHSTQWKTHCRKWNCGLRRSLSMPSCEMLPTSSAKGSVVTSPSSGGASREGP